MENIGYYFTVFAGTMLITRPRRQTTDKYGLVRLYCPRWFVCPILSYYQLQPKSYYVPAGRFVAAFGYGAKASLQFRP